MMKVTDVRIKLVKKDDVKVKGIASVSIDDCLVIHDLKVIQGSRQDGQYFVAMPSKRTSAGDFRDIVHPLNVQTRELITEYVLKEYEAELVRFADRSAKAEDKGVPVDEAASSADDEKE
jgi:stage V sporulation protein G